MSKELKPCPFCGGEAEIMGDQYPYVECQKCAVSFTHDHSYDADFDDAASKWNSRKGVVPKMTRIAESKVRQLGGDVCGVLVRKEDGTIMAVSEDGRCTRLDGEVMGPAAARAQGGQGAEPVKPGDPLPCPFCGSTDVGGAGGTVGCYRCPAEIAVQNANTAYAVELWNNRVKTQPQPTQQGSAPSRDDLIQCILATQAQSEGVMADAILSMLTTPQPQGDGWLYREPDHGEEDYCGQVWTLDCNGQVELLSKDDCIAEFMSSDAAIIAFQPTGLKRPQPPKEHK